MMINSLLSSTIMGFIKDIVNYIKENLKDYVNGT